MRSVLAFLEQASAAGDSPDLEAELGSTRKQLDAMLNAASDGDQAGIGGRPLFQCSIAALMPAASRTT